MGYNEGPQPWVYRPHPGIDAERSFGGCTLLTLLSAPSRNSLSVRFRCTPLKLILWGWSRCGY